MTVPKATMNIQSKSKLLDGNIWTSRQALNITAIENSITSEIRSHEHLRFGRCRLYRGHIFDLFSRLILSILSHQNLRANLHDKEFIMQVSVPDKNVGYILSRGLLDKKSGALFRDNKKLAIILSTIENGQKKGETVNEIINQIDRKLVPNSPSATQKNQLDFISKLLRQCVESQVGLTILIALCRDIAPLCNAAG